MGLMGFGGVLPLARRSIVEDHRWLTSEEFVELLGLCQFLPGGNIMNLSVAVGYKFHGLVGALACIVGVVLAPIFVVIALGVFYNRFQDDPHIRHMFIGIAAAAAGLLVALALKIVMPLRRRPVDLVICAVSIITIVVLKIPLLIAMIVLAPLSMLIVWRMAR